MIYKKIKLFIFILIAIFSFKNNTFAQNSIGVELIYKLASRNYPLSSLSRNFPPLYTYRLGILGNYTLDENDKHRVETGIYTSIISVQDSDYYYLPSIRNVAYTNFKSSSYFIVIPIRYSYHIKHFYVEGGLNGGFIVASRVWAGNEFELISKEKHYSPFILEYHLGIGYKYSYKKFDFRLGISSEIYSKFTYHDTGIDIGVNYKFK